MGLPLRKSFVLPRCSPKVVVDRYQLPRDRSFHVVVVESQLVMRLWKLGLLVAVRRLKDLESLFDGLVV